MTAARVVILAGLALLAAGVAAALAASQPRLAGTNDLRAGDAIALAPGRRLCQAQEEVFADADRLRLLSAPGTADGPPLAVELRDGRRTVARGAVAGGYAAGYAVARLDRVTDARLAEVCVTNAGEEPVALLGQALPPEQAARLDGEPAPGRLRLEWVRPGSESWLALVPVIAHRFGFGKADWLGSWTLWLAAALVVCAIGLSARLLWGGRP